MATLVLSAVGSAFGPVGSAVGMLIGGAIDGRIFGAKGRQGPRLQDLKVQTSSYGAAMPKLFGTMRVAGTVIWATDLVEQRSRQGGGKGRPSSTSYSYSASFAVLLSARPIRSVARIWADGNLLRGAAGDWKRETGFRLHLGGEGQAADPFIASAEAADGTPAYRGCAYAVFENMALAPFGNRIPSLSFEVEADAEPVAVGAMLQELSGGIVVAEAGQTLRGFAASGDSVRALIETLDPALPMRLRDDGVRLRLANSDDPTVALDAAEIGDDVGEDLPGLAELPGVAVLSYYEPARDHQAGVQHARRPGERRTERIELPAALDAGEARSLVETSLARRWREQGRRSIRCGWARIGLAPGAVMRLPDAPHAWRVAARTVDRDGVRFELRRMASGSIAAIPAEPGRGLAAPDLVHGATIVHLLDLPNLSDNASTGPRLWIVAAGRSPGWRRAALLASLDDGASGSPIGTTAAPAVIGSASGVLSPAPAALIDRHNGVTVALAHAGMTLGDADEPRLLGGANLALLGDELIQFGQAEPLGGTHWRLTHLVRGRRGTGWAAPTHAAGERFLLIEADTMLPYDPPLSAAARPIRLLASGIGDPVPVEAGVPSAIEALRPPSPAQLRALRRSDGGIDLSWARSSRIGWAWIDGADAPLGEEREAYLLTIDRADGFRRVVTLATAAFQYAAEEVAEDRAAGGPVMISVVQLGTSATSRPAVLTIDL